MRKKKTIEIMRNTKIQKNEYFVGNYDVTESVEYLLAEVEREYEFKKQVELQCGMRVSNDFLNKQAEKYKKQIADLEAKLAESNKSHHKNIVELTKMATEKDRKIEELKQQLAEKDKAIENWQTMYESVVQTCHNDKEEIKKLKKQNDDYADSLTKVLNENADLVFKLAEKENELEEVKQHRTQILNFGKRTKKVVIANPYGEDCVVYNQENQDKISFAVERLEKVKEFCNQREKDFTYLRDEIKAISHNKWVDYIEELRFIKAHIDNQIKQLKEGK